MFGFSDLAENWPLRGSLLPHNRLPPSVQPICGFYDQGGKFLYRGSKLPPKKLVTSFKLGGFGRYGICPPPPLRCKLIFLQLYASYANIQCSIVIEMSEAILENLVMFLPACFLAEGQGTKKMTKVMTVDCLTVQGKGRRVG